MKTPNQVEVTFAFHPADYSAFQAAASVAGLDEQSFGVLAIHREAQRVLDEAGRRHSEPLRKVSTFSING